MKIICKIIPAALLLVTSLAAYGQQITPVNYREYMDKVTAGNIEYAAERLNVDISEAEVVASKVFNDPTLAVSYYNNSQWDKEMGYGTEIEVSKVFTFGTRKAGINLAKSEKELTEALLADYFRNLRAHATITYLEALKQYELYHVMEDSYTSIRRLAVSDSIRYALGEITEVDAIQTRLEADILYNELLQSETELYSAFAELNILAGSTTLDTVFQPEATMQLIPREFILNNLVATALDNRTDLVAALKNKEVAARELILVRRERNPEVEISLSANINSWVHNEIAPAPSFTGYAAGIAIPLKFSNTNKGAVRAARIRQQQAEVLYQQVEVQIQTEVMQSYHRYQSLSKQVKRYEERLLTDAQRVIDGKRFSYNRGEVSLLEVLDAQRTYNDVRKQYIETLFNHASALVELQRDAGIWDIKL